MYVGRFVVVGPGIGAYRVSSRSFPNRRITDRDGILTVGPTPDARKTDNPYVAYNCLRLVDGASIDVGGSNTEGRVAVVGNGSHVDPIAEKLEHGYPARDALASSLLALDFEKDDYDTPRIAGVVGDSAFVGIVRRDALLVERVTESTVVATYEKADPEPLDFEVSSADEAARQAFDLDFEHPVCSAAVVIEADEADVAIVNG